MLVLPDLPNILPVIPLQPGSHTTLLKVINSKAALKLFIRYIKSYVYDGDSDQILIYFAEKEQLFMFYCIYYKLCNKYSEIYKIYLRN